MFFGNTFSRMSLRKLVICSKDKSTTCSIVDASMSRRTVPLSRKLRSSNNACKLSVATCGLDHLFPPSSTSSSNLIHLQKQCIIRVCSLNHNKFKIFSQAIDITGILFTINLSSLFMSGLFTLLLIWQ